MGGEKLLVEVRMRGEKLLVEVRMWGEKLLAEVHALHSSSTSSLTVLFAGPEFECLTCKHVNGNNTETFSCFRNFIFFLHALMARCGYQTSAQMSATLWAVELNNSEGFCSSICWSKLQSFSFISKSRVNLWYIWYSNVHVQEHTHSMKEAYPTNEKFGWQLWADCGADTTWTYEKVVFDWFSLQISFCLGSDNHGVSEDTLLIAVAWCSSYFWSKWKYLVWMSPWNKDLGPPRELLSCCNS